ncbi:hypothetical protein SSS_00093 [Sarcoptes scabiei]|nr:hypothetical protein SSS_00093 [Sarcoptes scabiei]
MKRDIIPFLCRLKLNLPFSRRLSSDSSLKLKQTQALNEENVPQERPKRKQKLYQNLYNWNNDIDLVKLLASNIIYKKCGLIAISKPWGVGVNQGETLFRSNHPGYSEQLLNDQTFGECRTSVRDVLDLLGQYLNIPELHIIKALDRKWSGILLLSDQESQKQFVEKSCRKAKADKLPYMRFLCIVNGIIPSAQLNRTYQERCGVRLIEIDELGDCREPVYVSPDEMTKNHRSFLAIPIFHIESIIYLASRSHCNHFDRNRLKIFRELIKNLSPFRNRFVKH